MRKIIFLLLILITSPIFAASIPAVNITGQCSCTSDNGALTCQKVPAARMVAFELLNQAQDFTNGPIAAPKKYSQHSNTVNAPIINYGGMDSIVTSPPGIGSYTYAAVFPASSFKDADFLYVVLVYDPKWKIETLTPFSNKWLDKTPCQYSGPSIIQDHRYSGAIRRFTNG